MKHKIIQFNTRALVDWIHWYHLLHCQKKTSNLP